MKCKLHLVKHVDVTIDVADAEIHVEIANITSGKCRFRRWRSVKRMMSCACAGEVVQHADRSD